MDKNYRQYNKRASMDSIEVPDVDKIKKLLIEKGIPEEQIAIKTSKIDDISKVDLMSEDCPLQVENCNPQILDC